MTNREQDLPLSGVRILELTHAVMGPSAGMILADLGADVVHIEPTTGDPTRRLEGFGKGYFPYFNRNKKSLAVDLKSEAGKNILWDLLVDADVLVENFGPGTLERLGFGYEPVAKRCPRLIYCTLKGFMPGPYSHRHAMDEVVQMMGGLAYMTGPSGQPLRAGASVVDIAGGMFGVMGTLLALYERERTGKGTLVRGTLFETTAFLMGQHMAVSALTGKPVPPMPERVSAWSVYRIFHSRDGEPVFIGIISERHWRRFCEVFDRDDLLADDTLRTNNSRIRERERLLPDLEAMFRQMTRDDIVQRCEDGGIPFAPIARPEDLFTDPQLSGPQGLLETTFPGGVRTRMPRLPMRIGDHDFGLRKDPPGIGADVIAILTELGYDSARLKELQEQGVISVEAREES